MILGIMFDMDNTLLQSNINFKRMKSDIVELLIQNSIISSDFPIHEHTTSTLIEYARAIGISDELYGLMMARTAQHELLGMQGADLEPGARELLEILTGKLTLVVITNNSRVAAMEALVRTGIADFFQLIIGREQMSALKPSPSGFHYVMSRFPSIKLSQWISIGDSWIDGRASQEAGIPFISYRADLNTLHLRGVKPTEQISHLMELLDLIGYN